MGLVSSFGVPIAIIAIAIAFLGVIVFVARNYLRCPPNEVLVLFGRQHRFIGDDGKAITRGYRLITGGAAFRVPLLEQSKSLSLALFAVPVKVEDTPNKDGVLVTIESVANVRLSSNPTLLGAAVEQFLGKTGEEIEAIIHSTLEGIVRQLVGTLTIEEMVRDREAIAHRVIELTTAELAKLGVECKNFVLTKVTDKKGYIDALGRKRAAEVLRDAEIGEAEAKREATIKSSTALREAEEQRLKNEAQVADANRDLAVKKAKYDAETQAEQAKVALAGQIAKAEQEKELKLKVVAVEQTEVEAKTGVAEKRAVLAEKELEATRIKQAEAEKRARIIEAEAAKQARILTAEAEKQAAITEAEGQATAAASQARAAEEQAKATKAAANAEQARLAALGKGEAEALEARGRAEGEAVKAKLLAEAEGVKAKNDALAQMSEGARLILVLDRLPEVLEQGGEALAKAIGPAFQGIGAGLAAVDRIEIIDLGSGANGQGTAVERFALAVPQIVLRALTAGQATGIDLSDLLGKLGIRVARQGGASASAPHADGSEKA